MAKKNSKNISELIPLLIPFAFYGAMYKYLYDLEKNKACECSNTDNRKLLKKLVITWVVLTFIMNILPFFLKSEKIINKGQIILILLSLSLFIYLSVTFVKYEKEINAKDCKCSEDIKRTLFRYYLYTGWVLWGLIILFNFIYIMLIVNNKRNAVIKTNL